MYFKFKKPNLFLYFCAIIVNLTSFIIGCCFAWSSSAIPRLNGSIEPYDNPLGPEAILTLYDESWIASLVSLGAAASSLISGHLADKRGRKEMLVISAFIIIIGFGIMHFAQTVSYICLARFVCGLGIGIIFTVIPMYVGEIAENSNRGTLGMFMVLFMMTGILFTNGVGSIVTLNNLNIINFAAPILFLAIFDWFMPETPSWLIAQNRLGDAEKALRKLRVCSEEKLILEFEEIKKSVQESLKNKKNFKHLFKQNEFVKGICITCGLVIFQQLSGVNVILFYMRSIFEETGSILSADLSVVIIGAVQVTSCLISSFFVDAFGRKILVLLSGIGTTISLIAFGVYFYLKQIGGNVDEIYWLPIVSIICFMTAYAVGFGPIPFVVLGEIFPSSIKGLASTITIFVCLIFTFCTTTLFPLIIIYLGMSYTFWLFAVFCFISIIFTYSFVPETKGKSLNDIQELLHK